MENLTFKIDEVKNTVTFTFEKHQEIVPLTKGMDYQKLIDRCVTVEQDERVINSGNLLIAREELIFRDEKGLPLISILKNMKPLTQEDIDKIEEEYNQACRIGNSDLKNWREFYQKTTGNVAPKDSI